MGEKKRFRNPNRQAEEVVEEEVVEEVVTEEPEDAPEPTPEHVFGVVSHCATLNIRKTPELFRNNVVTVVSSGTELEIDNDNSTNEWFKVYTKEGVTGFCMKKYVTVK